MNKIFLGESLIFIISQTRAGSTLLQRILAGNPQVQTSAETWLMLHPVYALRDKGFEAEYNATLAHQAIQDFLNNYANGEDTYMQSIRAMASVLYGKALANKDAKYFLDKTPRYYFIIPELYRLFPKAKFIILLRNPLSVLYSILISWVEDNGWPYLNMFRYDLLQAPRFILEGIDILGNDVNIVRYESLVNEPDKAIDALCQRLGIKYYPDMLNYGDRQVPKGRMGDTIGIKKHRKPSIASLNNWIHLADREQTRHFALSYLKSLGQKTIKKLGYSFKDLKEAMNGSEFHSSASIIPWHIAIRPAETWTRNEYLVVRRAIFIQGEGAVRGNLSFIRQNYRSLIRSLLPI